MLESNDGDLLNIYMFRKVAPILTRPFNGVVALEGQQVVVHFAGLIAHDKDQASGARVNTVHSNRSCLKLGPTWSCKHCPCRPQDFPRTIVIGRTPHQPLACDSTRVKI